MHVTQITLNRIKKLFRDNLVRSKPRKRIPRKFCSALKGEKKTAKHD